MDWLKLLQSLLSGSADDQQQLVGHRGHLSDMEDDDIFEIDSPEQEVVDQIDDDGLDGDELVLAAQQSTSYPRVKDKPREKQLEYPQSLPYKVETIAEMDDKLDLIVRRLVDCVNAKDYDVGLLQWNHRLECWISMKYPMKREVRVKLARLYFELCVLPGMDARIVEQCTNMCISLIEAKKKIDIVDLQLPWRSLYAILEKELFPKQRKTGITNVATTLLSLTEYSQRFFPPHEIPAMLKAFLPRLSANLNSILATQAFCTHFLPLSHPQYYLPAVFKLWEAFNSNHYDDAWLDVMDRLAMRHLNPKLSNPAIIEELRNAAKERGELVPEEVPLEQFDDSTVDDVQMKDGKPLGEWPGIRKDVSIFTDSQWDFMMTKCLRIMAVPIPGSSTSAAAIDFSVSDAAAGQTALTMKKPTERLVTIASLIVHSMSVDGEPSGKTPMGSKAPSREASSVNLPSLADQQTKTYLAGSKALESLAKLMQATENFYHPANYGPWAPLLGRFLQNISYEFLRRWSDEQKKECQTPQAWRLTPDIKKHFVLTMRTVALLSMYSRDPITIACAHSALRTLSHLEPDLIVDAVLERAFPALENLTETHRTTSSLSALAQLGPLLASRSLHAAGAKNLLPLLELSLPGLDVNDPLKTMSTAMFIASVASRIVFDDLTRLNVDEMDVDGGATDETTPKLTVNGEDAGIDVEEENRLVREMTAGFPEWVASFFRQVIALFEALPEPGKGNRNGGKAEETMTMTLVLACDFVCAQMSDALFDMALKLVFEHATSNVRSNSMRGMSQLVSCFARAHPSRVLHRFFDICDMNIRQELEQGAASTRTTTSTSNAETDVTLHWWIGLLVGSLTNAGVNFLPYKDRFISLLQYMSEHCKTETSYSAVAKMAMMVLLSLTNVFAKDHRSVNPDEWQSKKFQMQHHQQWGKTFEAKQVKIDWHVPNAEEIDTALEILRTVAEPLLAKLNTLVDSPQADSSKVWTNDFCRYCAVLKACINGIPSLAQVPNPPTEPGAPMSDMGDEVKDFVFHLPHMNSNVLLSDPQDPRHQFVMKLRDETGEMLHRAVQSLKLSGAEDSIDCVRMIIHTMKTLALDYPLDSTHHSAVKKSYEFALQMSRVIRNDKHYPRYVWIRRAVLYHASRMRLNSFYKSRSKLLDKHLFDLCELALSPYVQIRRSAQRGLDAMTHYYDGTRSLLYERLFQALAPGTEHTVMKGALFTLGSKMFQNVAILDWRYGPKYILTLLACSHQERPSVQNLVKSVTHDFVIRWAEPSTEKAFVRSESLEKAAAALATVTSRPEEPELLQRVKEKAADRVKQKNEAYDALAPQLLAIAQDPSTHWRYSLTTTRFIRAMIRRDQPLRSDVSVYLTKQLISEHPNQRTHSMLALTKTLHFVKLRTMCGGSGDSLLLQQTSNPLKRKVKLEHPLPPDFTQKFIESFSKPIDKDTLLMDKQNTGWLVWGDYVEFCAVPQEDEGIEWDSSSKEALESIRSTIMQQSWWDSFTQNLSQEKSNDFIAADATTLVKSIAQIFTDEPLRFIRDTIDGFVSDKDDRHKQRAAGELIAGMVRGSKHWPRKKQDALWDWLAPKLPQILLGMTPETQPAWEMTVEYILNSRDPRRNKPLVDFITSLTIEQDSSEAFNTAKQQDLVGTAMKSLGWHFAPWSMKYINMYSQNLDHPFGEVRGAVSENLRHLSEARLHPSYSSVEVFLRESRQASVKDMLMHVDAEYDRRIEEMTAKLDEWRRVRQPTAQGTQAYDRASLTILTWIWTSISDFRISTAFPFITKMLPEFFRMSEILDNDELRGLASKIVLSIACLQFPEALARQLMSQFLQLLRESSSWRVRLDVLHPLQVFYFHNIYLLDDHLVAELMEALCDLLRDPKIEVRQAAADALSGMVRCSHRHAIVGLSNRFMSVIRSVKIPKRRNASGEEVPGYQEALVSAHSAVLGIASLINAFPFEVPPFIPSIMIETMTKHSTSPPPISTTVKKCLADFKRSHTDSWAEDQKAFTEEQLMSLHDLLTGSSYYA